VWVGVYVSVCVALSVIVKLRQWVGYGPLAAVVPLRKKKPNIFLMPCNVPKAMSDDVILVYFLLCLYRLHRVSILNGRRRLWLGFNIFVWFVRPQLEWGYSFNKKKKKKCIRLNRELFVR